MKHVHSHRGRARGGRFALAFLALAVGIAVGSLLGTPAIAIESSAEADVVKLPPGWYAPQINEVRLGGMAHGIGNPERNTAAIDGEILSSVIFRPDDPMFWWFAPRLHVGGHVSTDNRTSYGYFGLTWTWDNLLIDRTFLEFSFGGSVNDGYTGTYAPLDRAKLGCPVLFRESGSIGYRLTDNWSIMATVDHISNGGLCGLNRGITNVGARLGYRF